MGKLADYRRKHRLKAVLWLIKQALKEQVVVTLRPNTFPCPEVKPEELDLLEEMLGADYVCLAITFYHSNGMDSFVYTIVVGLNVQVVWDVYRANLTKAQLQFQGDEESARVTSALIADCERMRPQLEQKYGVQLEPIGG